MFSSLTSKKKLYFKNIRKVIYGTAAAQIVTLVSLPILSRLYSVEDFGLLGIYIALANIGRVVYCLRFDLAIQSTRNNRDARTLVWLCIALGFIISCCGVVFLYFVPVNSLISLAAIIYLLPWMIFASSIDNVLGVWINRLKLFQVFAFSRLFRALLIVISQLGLYKLTENGLGLVIGVFVGEVLTIIMMSLMLKQKNIVLKLSSIKELYKIMLENKANPKYLLPGHSLNICIAQLPIFIVSSLYGKESAGYIYIAQRIVSMPGQLISNAIFKVFFSEGASTFKASGSCYQLTVSTLRSTALPLTLIFISLAVGSVFFLGSLLGEKWDGAKYIVFVYALSEIIPALFHPISAVWFITDNQKLNLKYQIYRALIIGFTLFLSQWFEELLYFVIAYGLARTVSYLMFLSKCIELSRGISPAGSSYKILK